MFPVLEIENRLIPKTTVTIRSVQVLLDVLVLAAAFAFAYILRFEFSLQDPQIRTAAAQMVLVVVFQILILRLFGIHKFIWRYIGILEANHILRALAVASLPFLFIGFAIAGSLPFPIVPVSIVIIDFLLAAVGILGIRLIRREIYENMRFAVNAANGRGNERRSVLLIGAGRAGLITLAELKTGYNLNYQVEGFIDDDPLRQGLVISGVKVLGKTADIPRLVRELDVDHVIITIAQLSRTDMQRILGVCKEADVKVKTIPCLSDLLEEKVFVSRIRDVEVEDLLGRSPIQLDRQSIQTFLSGKTVLITGAGGSIGSELVRQLLHCNTRRLVLVERSEFALFSIENEVRGLAPACEIVRIIGDVCDFRRMSGIFRRYSPQVIFHAAAHKHVPMMEDNAAEALKNNVLGTNIVGQLAGRNSAEAFVLISTDKAVRPTSVMGASKRVAELVIQDLNSRFDTRYVAVRFGNVMGSTGSVIPIFREQIRAGKPLTVTHPEMKRFFMTIPEASQLVLQAGAIGSGGEIFMLDMGEPVRILDLARDMIRLSGLSLGVDAQIVFTGIRPGEKLFEEIETDTEQLCKTIHSKIFIAQIASFPQSNMPRMLQEVEDLCISERDSQIRSFLNRVLPEAGLVDGKTHLGNLKNDLKTKATHCHLDAAVSNYL